MAGDGFTEKDDPKDVGRALKRLKIGRFVGLGAICMVALGWLIWAEGWGGLADALAASGVSRSALVVALLAALLSAALAAVWWWKVVSRWRPHGREPDGAVTNAAGKNEARLIRLSLVVALVAAISLDSTGVWPRTMARALLSDRQLATRGSVDVDPPKVVLSSGPRPPQIWTAPPADEAAERRSDSLSASNNSPPATTVRRAPWCSW